VGAAHATFTAPGPAVAFAGPRAWTLLEDLIFASDRRDAPLTVGAVLRTDGAFREVELRRAVDDVLARYPMCRARLRTHPVTGREWWFADRPGTDVVAVTSGQVDADLREALAGLCARPFDLRSTGPLRVLLVRAPGGDALIVVAHHVAMDGLSIELVARGILEAYADRVGRPADAAADVYPAGSGVGPSPADPAAGPPPEPRRPNPVAADAAMLGRRAPARLAPAHSPALSTPPRWAGDLGWRLASPDRPRYGVWHTAIGLPARRPIRPGVPVTVNDILMAATHLAVERWNRARGRGTGEIRVRMPVDVRPPGQPPVVGNVTGQTIVSTEADDRLERTTLLETIGEQTRLGKSGEPLAEPGATVGILGAVPFVLRDPVVRAGVSVSRHIAMPTTTVTNLGRLVPMPRPAEGPTVTSVHFAAFAGMPQGLTIAVAGYDGLLNVTFCYHRRLFDELTVRAFADIFTAAVRDLG
jgi:NRPS condensation-like uncharacterized protein